MSKPYRPSSPDFCFRMTNENERNSIQNLKIPPIYLQPEMDPGKKSGSRKNKCKVDDCHLKVRKRCKMSCPMCKNGVPKD